MRRLSTSVVIAAVVASGVLTACGTSDRANGITGASSGSGLVPAGEGTTEYPLTLTTWAGETVLKERPERIAVIGSTSVYDAVAALSVIPVYSYTHPAGEEFGWWDPQQRKKIEKVEYSKVELDAESIATTKPDLIITLNYWFENESEVKRLMEIAPVLDYETRPGNKEDWRLGQRAVGKALDLSAAADQAIADADKAVARVAADNPSWAGKTVAFATDYGTDYGVDYYTVPGGYAEKFFTELGFAPNPLAKEFAQKSTVSEERIDLLNADVLIMSYFEEGLRTKRETKPLFAALPPVREGRYVADKTPGGTWVLRQGASALSVPWLAQVVADEWLKDIDLGK